MGKLGSRWLCLSQDKLNGLDGYFKPESHSKVTIVWPGPRSQANRTAPAGLMG
jgi:hypothetical protein